MSELQIPRIISKLYALVDELQELFPGRPFTPDGHLVGSIGEVVAKYFYDLELMTPSAAYDARTKEPQSRSVQIKLTAGDSVALAVNDATPDILIVLRINRKLGFEEIFNGPYPCELLTSKKATKRAVKSLSVRQLRNANEGPRLNDEGRISKLNEHFRRPTE